MSKLMSISKSASQRLTLAFLVAGVIIFVVSGWMWWSRVYNSPGRVFWGMIDTSLSTSSVTRRSLQKSDGQSQDRYTELRSGSQNAVRTVEKRQQSSGTSDSTVVQESIGTPDTDYLRFPYISTGLTGRDGKKIDYSSIQGVWGKTPAAPKGKQAQVQNFVQAVLGTVPFGNLPAPQRKTLVKYIYDARIYTVDTSRAVKKRENGKAVYEYTLQVNPKQYFTMLQQFATILGLGPVPGLDPAQYDTTPPLNVRFSVAVNSRQLTQIYYVDGNQGETYDSYGVRTPISLPDKTIPLADLEKRIQSL